jgi:hypothetical protein
MLSKDERRKLNVVQLSAYVILGQVAKLTEDEAEMIIDAMLDIYPNMEENEIEKYEARPRLAAEIVLRKKTGADKQLSPQNMARQFLASERTVVVVKPALPQVPVTDAPHRIVRGIMPVEYTTIRENPNATTERYGIYIPRDAFERYVQAVASESLVALLDGKILARVMGPVDNANIVQVSPTLYKMLQSPKVPVRVQFVTDLQPIQKITFRYLGCEREACDLKPALEQLFVNLPGVALGQVFKVSPQLTVQVQALEPAVGYGTMPFDGDVQYELEPMRLEHRLVFCAACASDRPRYRMQGTSNVYFCGRNCQSLVFNN